MAASMSLLTQIQASFGLLDRQAWSAATEALEDLAGIELTQVSAEDRQALQGHPTLVADLLARYRHMPARLDGDEDTDEAQESYRWETMAALNRLVCHVVEAGARVVGTPAETVLADLDHWPLADGRQQTWDRDTLIGGLLRAGARTDVTVVPFQGPLPPGGGYAQRPEVSPLAYVLMGGFYYEEHARGLAAFLAHGVRLPDYEAFFATHARLSGGHLEHPWSMADREGCLSSLLAQFPVTPARVFALLDPTFPGELNQTPFAFVVERVRTGLIPSTIRHPQTGETLLHAWARANPEHEMTTEGFETTWHELIQLGAPATGHDHLERTPLHTLIGEGQPDLGRLAFLLKQGLDPDQADATGQTARDLAQVRLAQEDPRHGVHEPLLPESREVLHQLVAEGRQQRLAQPVPAGARPRRPRA